MRSLTLVFLCGSLALLFIGQRVDATINCYSCVSTTDTGCGENWKADGISTVTCAGSCSKVDVGGVFTRGCMAVAQPNDCTGDDGAEVCYCDESECNTGTNMAASVVVMTITALLAAIFNYA